MAPRDLGAYELFPTGDAPVNSLPGPYSVHANIDDPRYGVFFGNYKRRFRLDFDVLF